ncbi:putative ribonuclease H-like domain-containing protein, partial [Tanacetum coccineum]
RVDPSNKIVPRAVLLQYGIVDISSTRPNLSTPVPTGRRNLSKPVTNGRRNFPTPVPTGKAVPAGRPNYPILVAYDFKLPDETQVLLKVPRKHNLYSFNLEDLAPQGDLACLLAKATLDESTQWHRRLGHVNFKNMNKLVKGNLVRGLPPKLFQNDHTCVACNKGKQHKVSYKAKTAVSSFSEPLQMLHMDLFRPTSVRSISHKFYCLVITDAFSRFSWVFFLAKKDETVGILKEFIKLVENQLNKKVKVIRCDNGTEFKNRDLIEFCGSKGIKRDYSNPRTPQQNGVAERKNRTLIEAARTMLADSFLPTMFWTEAVATACYVLNRVLVTNPHNKTPYELLTGIVPTISYLKPFGCHVTILNTIDQLGKFDGKSDEGFLVGYSTQGKAYRVYNLASKRVEETMNVKFLENKPNVLPMQLLTMQVLKTDPSWVEAMQEEMQQFQFQNVWILVDLPLRKREIGTKWILKNKKDARGIVIRNKARLVAQGHRQEEGIDYDEVFALVARIEAIRLFLAYASFIGFMVYQMDVKSAFLYGKIEEDAPRAWYTTLSTFLLKNGYRRGTIDKTLFIKKDLKDIILVQVYVDDIIFGFTKKAQCDEFEDLMQSEFEISSMGELTFFLGLQVEQRSDGIFISQGKYVAKILRKFDLESVKTATTPYEPQKPKDKNGPDDDVNVHLYRSMIGSLMYLTASMPDIMFVVSTCSRFQVTPKTSNLLAVKRIFKYLKGQPKLGLWYPRDSPFELEAYTDSDYDGNHNDRKSTTGGCQFLGRRLISWQCKKQTIMATSSTEAEYVAAAHCCGQVRLDLEVILCFDGEKVHNFSLVLVINHSYWLIPIGPGGLTVTTG